MCCKIIVLISSLFFSGIVNAEKNVNVRSYDFEQLVYMENQRLIQEPPNIAPIAHADCTADQATQNLTTILGLVAQGLPVYVTSTSPNSINTEIGIYTINFAIIKSGVAEIGTVKIDRETCKAISMNSTTAHQL